MDKVKCKRCGKDVSLRKNGTLRIHGPRDEEPCALSGCPVDVATARFCTAPDVHGSPCGMTAEAGAERCGDHLSDSAPTVDVMDDTQFEDPTVAAPKPPETNVSGQPDPARDQWGRYLLPNPATGLYSDDGSEATRRNGWMRATTFAKSAADTYALTRYDERLTLVGATLRPDVVALAHGKDVREHKQELNRLVTQVKDAAGAKVAANIGTAVHGFTELWDSGQVTIEQAASHQYVDYLRSYQRALNDAQLEPVPGLIERTTFVNEWGGLAGTFDRVLYHRPTNTYLIGDLKTGRDLSYGRMEIAVQLALYAHGINAHGVFDWLTGKWVPPMPKHAGPVKVRTDYGVVMHLPIQGPDAGKCTFKRVNLAAGWDAARVCGDVISSRKRKDYMDDEFALPMTPYAPELPSADAEDWDGLFSSVTAKEQATALWRQAKAEGIAGVELNRLIALAQQALRSKG